MRLKQNSYDDVLNYLEVQKESGKTERESAASKKGDENFEVRRKCVEFLKPFFSIKGFVEQALNASNRYTHIMEFSRIRVIESMFALLRKGTSNIIEYNENHSEFPLTDE